MARIPNSVLLAAQVHPLRAARALRGLSQSELEQLAGVPPTTVSRYENGSRVPDAATQLRLAMALDIDPDVLRPRVVGGVPARAQGGSRMMTDSDRLHAAAMEILRSRGEAMNEDAYLEALEQAQAAHAPELQSALAELGLADPEETVTAELLQTHAEVILAESGGDRVTALKQAIRELGAPGERRKDATPEAAFGRLLATAQDEGAIVSDAHADSFRVVAKTEPETARKIVAGLIDARRREKAPFSTRDGIEPDDESLDKHRRAEEWIAANVVGDGYDAETYMRALEHVEAQDAHAQLDAIERKRRETGNKRYAEKEEDELRRVVARARFA